MPNLCYTDICFKGKLENICRLVNDVLRSVKYMKETNYKYYNIGYFLSLSNFDLDIYNNDPNTKDIQRRCSIIGDYPLNIECYEDYAIAHLHCESAWYMDYNIFYLISLLYQVEFSAYSEEPCMDYYEKGKNGTEDTYDYDRILHLDADKVEYELDINKSTILDYHMPVKSDSYYTESLIDYIDERGIPYEEETIPKCDESTIHGIYYDK